MKSLIVVLTAAACALLPAHAAAGTLDQQQTQRNGFSLINTNLQWAQTFTAGQSGALDQVDVYLRTFSGTTGPLTVEIRDVSGGAPGSTVLASADVPAATVPIGLANASFVSVPLASPPLVVAGTQYAIVLSTTGSNSYNVFSQLADVYAGGAMFLRTSSAPNWNSVIEVCCSGQTTAADFAFKTYVLQYVASGLLAPVDTTQVNVAKAGRTVPLKWRVTDGTGDPVDDPAHFESVTSAGGPCDSSPSDAIETYAGSSGLQYLGDGYWQFNWQTSKQYAGQCRTLVLTLRDDSTLTADFRFK